MSLNLMAEAQSRWPSASLEALDTMLWMTPHPCISSDQVVACLDEFKAKYGDNISDVIDGEMAEFDRQWAEHKERENDVPKS